MASMFKIELNWTEKKKNEKNVQKAIPCTTLPQKIF